MPLLLEVPGCQLQASVLFVVEMSASVSICPLGAWHGVVCGKSISKMLALNFLPCSDLAYIY